MKKIYRIQPLPPAAPKRKRVAAYARVSGGKDAMLHSLSAQISYYSRLIQQHVEWEFAGIYADEAVTGTKENRKEFVRLLADCRTGKIDMVITKSVTRFARNTLTTLKTVRELKNMGVDVYFEKENIHSDSGDGELMLSILASYAQEESRSASENCKWRIRKGFAEGKPHGLHSMLGYRINPQGDFKVIPEEAEVVRAIFASYLSGMGTEAIMKALREQGMSLGRLAISNILKNATYTGELLLQSTFVADHLTKRRKINEGQLPKYQIKGHHEPIIEQTVFEAVQAEVARRADKYKPSASSSQRYPFSGRIKCGICGSTYRRRIAAVGTKYAKPVWTCQTYNVFGKTACPSQQIPETVLAKLVDEHGGMAEVVEIRVPKAQRITFIYPDGNEHTVEWHTTRRDSWTAEMRQTARERQLRIVKERNERKS